MSVAAMTAIVLILLTLTGVLRHTVEETGIKNTHVIYWLICVICLKAFLLNPTPEIELNFGLVPIITVRRFCCRKGHRKQGHSVCFCIRNCLYVDKFFGAKF